MTGAEQALYDRMSAREREAINALRPECRGAALVLWARVQGRRARPVPSRQESEMAPRREFVDDESERRFP